MIRHIVLIRFPLEMSELEISDIFSALPKLLGRLPGVLAFASGRSESPEKIERGFMHCFTIDFSSWAALAHYASDPEHQAFGRELVDHAAGGINGILVFDMEVK